MPWTPIGILPAGHYLLRREVIPKKLRVSPIVIRNQLVHVVPENVHGKKTSLRHHVHGNAQLTLPHSGWQTILRSTSLHRLRKRMEAERNAAAAKSSFEKASAVEDRRARDRAALEQVQFRQPSR